MSLLLDTGEAFVGDLAVGGPPLRMGPNMAPFADDPHLVIESWRMLIGRGARWFFPAHGRPFKVGALKNILKRAG